MIPVEKLRALFWAEIHMREALSAARHLAQLGSPPTELRHSILTGVVISYARSFGQNQGLSGIGGDFRKFKDPRLQILHDGILEARDVIYAHKDMVKLLQKLTIPGQKEEFQTIRIHIAAGGESHWVVQSASLPTELLPEIASLCEYQLRRFNLASSSMLKHFTRDKQYLPGDYILGESFP